MPDTSPWSRLRSEVYAFAGRNPRSNRAVPDMADLDPTHSILDIGCGPGAAVRRAAPAVTRAVGADRSESMVQIARRRSRRFGNVEFVVAGAEQLPFGEGTFDRVWTIHSFHHWEESDRGIAEARRILRPGGRFLIVESESRGSHGLDRSRADALSHRLLAMGFDDATVAEPKRQIVVTGVVGAGD